ncbi:MAG: methylated-DNA--[protein]-cysteine S-methyltransferase [Myxococcota bacterium]
MATRSDGRSGLVLDWALTDSPVGQLVLCASAQGLVSLHFLRVQPLEAALADASARFDAGLQEEDSPLLRRAQRQLAAYFAGHHHRGSVPLDLRGTPFQRRVWAALQQIPHGETETYGSLSAAIGKPDAVRAVGRACGRNPLPLFVPCHRVVAADGSLTGYLGGIETKRRLLTLERGEAAHLPLFAVADRRVDSERRALDTQKVSARLPAPAMAWLDRRRGAPVEAPAWSPEAWLTAVLDATTDEDLPALAALVATAATTDEDLALSAVTDDLLAMAAAHLIAAPPGADDVRCLLHAALSTDSAWHDVIVHRLIGTSRLSPAARHELERHLEAILDGSLVCSSATREHAVDLWSGLRHAAGDDAWFAGQSEDPSLIFARAGLYAEAIVCAEEQLARGDGPRAPLLRRLADAYEATGELESARERLLALVAERHLPSDAARLRELEDRLRHGGHDAGHSDRRQPEIEPETKPKPRAKPEPDAH